MKNWIPFSEQEYDQIGDRIYRDFKFEPSMLHFPSVQVPHPFITYDISDCFGGSTDLDAYDDLEEKALDAFKESPLDECYWGNPHLEFEKE